MKDVQKRKKKRRMQEREEEKCSILFLLLLLPEQLCEGMGKWGWGMPGNLGAKGERRLVWGLKAPPHLFLLVSTSFPLYSISLPPPRLSVQNILAERRLPKERKLWG
jgi:hypothetical protein